MIIDTAINQQEEYIRNELLSPTKHDLYIKIKLSPIEGITYEGSMYTEIYSNNKRAIVTMPYMQISEIGVSNAIIDSYMSISRLCTLIQTYHMFNRDYSVPIIAYLIAKSMTFTKECLFNIDSVLPSNSDLMKKLDLKIFNDNRESIDIIGACKDIFLKAVKDGKIPWLYKPITVGFDIGSVEPKIKKKELLKYRF